MRGRVRDYSIRVVGNNVKVYCLRPSDLPPQVAEWSKQIAESIRLVVDETAKIVFCSSMQKDKLSVEASDITGYSFALVFDIPSDKVVRESDQFTIELDWGEMLVTAKETTLNERADEILNAIGGSCDIDTTKLAKQGDNQEATLTAIYKLLIGSNEPSPDIPEGVAERLALILEFFGMKPIETYEFMTAEEVCSDLEEIMLSMDINLTQEKAKEITQQTLNN